jgi:hypothetical protein
LLVDVTVHESSTAPLVLSMTVTVAVSPELTVAFVSAYRFDTCPPFSGMPASSGLREKPGVLAGQLPLPCPASIV